MVDGVLTYIGSCACREYILAATAKPSRCVECGEQPYYDRPDPDCWIPGGSK